SARHRARRTRRSTGARRGRSTRRRWPPTTSSATPTRSTPCAAASSRCRTAPSSTTTTRASRRVRGTPATRRSPASGAASSCSHRSARWRAGTTTSPPSATTRGSRRLFADGPVTAPDLDAAAQFLAANARVLDRRRFERLFLDGDARPVRDAVAAFRNADGGFGHGLEPDGRTPASQPPAVGMALRTLDEAEAWDEELVAGACEWLAANEPAEGGASFVEPTVEGWPRAPWWEAEEGRPASLFTTGDIAATLHARHVEHRWLDDATA